MKLNLQVIRNSIKNISRKFKSCNGINGMILILLTFMNLSLVAQNDSMMSMKKEKSKAIPVTRARTYNYNLFSQLYPIRDNPTLGYITSYTKQEKIMFNVYPVLSLSLYNNFRRRLKEGKFFSQGYSFSLRPQLRMYQENSAPVKMPSYRVMLGLQHLYKLSQKHLISYSLESGHYSNGQSGSALAGGGEDKSTQSDSMWARITPSSNLSDLINRKNGDFTTNLTEVLFNYRFIPRLDAFSRPKQVHSFTTGFILYHDRMFGILNFGGFSDQAIKIYGRWRFLLSYAYSYNWKKGYRFMASENLELIAGAHPSVNPIRSVLQTTFYFPQSVGVFVNLIYGHDDYNLRFVDSGTQVGFGLTWDFFPPVEIGQEGE